MRSLGDWGRQSIMELRAIMLALGVLVAGESISAAQHEPLPSPPADQAGANTTNSSGSRIYFPAPVHDFGKVRGGGIFKHEFVVTNTGNRTLEITEVRRSCGCTTAGNWSKTIEPGQGGIIPIEFHTANEKGPVAKTLTVLCNAVDTPEVTLHVKANVWRPIEAIPDAAVLKIFPGSPSNEVAVIRILNHLDGPIFLSPPQSNQRSLVAELQTNLAGREFQVVIRAVPPLGAGNVFGKITLKTSSSEMPLLEIPAYAILQQAISVTPPAVTIPAGPITNRHSQIIAIRSNCTNALTLSEPALNSKTVEVSLKEVTPGRYFTVTLTFPEGFEMAPKEALELTLHSNHPDYRIIRVPIRKLTSPPGQGQRR